MARVAVSAASYDSVDNALREFVDTLDLGPFLAGAAGKKVFIKPNLLGYFPRENHATTDPAVVRAVVGLFIGAGAKVAVGDNCGVGGYGLNQRVAEKTGIIDAAQGTYKNVARDTVMVRLGSGYLDSLAVSRDMLEADILVSLPKMKTHSLTIITGAVKNMFGIVAGGGKGRSHAAAPGLKDFGRMLADIFSIRPPDLTIMDGIMAMEGNGPSKGRPIHAGLLLASRNAVALDAVACRIMGIEPERVHHVREASLLGLGPIERDSIEVIGAPPRLKFKLPVTVDRFRLGRIVNRGFFGRLVQSRLVLDPEKCRKCGLCREGCPAGAMSMTGYPSINEKTCIKCLCCHELCPESAWDLKGLMGRMQGYGSG